MTTPAAPVVPAVPPKVAPVVPAPAPAATLYEVWATTVDSGKTVSVCVQVGQPQAAAEALATRRRARRPTFAVVVAGTQPAPEDYR